MQAHHTEKLSSSHSRKSTPLGPLVLPVQELAYIAGFFDGEGMIAISKCKPKGRTNYSYNVVIKVSQSQRAIIDWIHDRLGGWILIKKFKRKEQRDHFSLTQKSLKATRILEALLPYLLVKKQQAQAAIKFQNLQLAHKNKYEVGRNGPVPRTPQELAYKEHYFNLLKKLKRV